MIFIIIFLKTPKYKLHGGIGSLLMLLAIGCFISTPIAIGTIIITAILLLYACVSNENKNEKEK